MSQRILVILGVAAVLGSASLTFCLSVSGHTHDGDDRAFAPERNARGAPAPSRSSERKRGRGPAAGASQAPPAVRLSDGPRLSPVTPAMVRHMRAIASRSERREDVFAKIGDSATVSRAFLECFGGDLDAVDLDRHEALRPTLEHFRRGNAGGRDPFRRDGEAAAVGWSARHLLAGNPPPILREVRAISPRFAFVLNGGNDVEGEDPARFANRMLRIVRHLELRGVIPILGSIMPRADDPDAELWVRRHNGVTRAIAKAEHLPYIDFHQALSGLDRRGLAGDGVHPNVLVSDGQTRPCDLTPEGLRHGNNLRNLLALQMLDLLRRTVVEGGRAPAPPSPQLEGRGTVQSPFAVQALPFTDMRSTSESGQHTLDGYACGPDFDESGPEHVYRFTLERPRRLRAWVFYEGDVDVDLHLLEGRPEPSACSARDDKEIVADLDPGVWHVVVDTFSEGDTDRAGDYMLVLDVEGDYPPDQG